MVRVKFELIYDEIKSFASIRVAFGHLGFVLDNYVAAIGTHADAVKKSNPTLAIDLREASRHQEKIWRAIVDWNALLVKRIPPSQAEFTAFLATGSSHPEFRKIQEQARYRQGDPLSLYNNLSPIFKHPFVGDLITVDRWDPPKGKYYSTNLLWNLNKDNADTEYVSIQLVLNYYYDPQKASEMPAPKKGKPAQPKVVDTGKFLVERSSKKDAPQAILAKAVLKMLETPGDKSPEQTAIDVAKLVLSKNDIHPVAHLQILEKTVVGAAECGPILAVLFADHKKALKDLKSERAIPWMNPVDPRTVKETPRARFDLEGFPSFDKLSEKLRTILDGKNQELASTRAIPVGFLIKSKEEGWRLQPEPELTGDFQLVTVEKLATGAGEWVPVGNVRQGQVSIDAGLGVPQGSLVFAQRIP